MFHVLTRAISAAFSSRAQLIAENLCLRQQLSVLQRRSPQPRLRNADWRFWILREPDVTVTSTGLARLLVLAITARATEYRSSSHASVTSGSHPADDD